MADEREAGGLGEGLGGAVAVAVADGELLEVERAVVGDELADVAVLFDAAPAGRL